MRRKAMCLAVVLALCAAFSANASESRSQALLYNLAFEDMTDIFIFPNLLPQYEGLYFHLPPGLGDAYGGLVYNLDANSAVGVFIHRPLVGAFDPAWLALTDADGMPMAEAMRRAPGGRGHDRHRATR